MFREKVIGTSEHGTGKGPKLTLGDWELGFWNARKEKYPECVQQRCWVYKTANALYKVLKSLKGRVKADLDEISIADK